MLCDEWVLCEYYSFVFIGDRPVSLCKVAYEGWFLETIVQDRHMPIIRSILC